MSPLRRTTSGRYSSGTTRPGTAWASSVLSHIGRSLGGVGTSSAGTVAPSTSNSGARPGPVTRTTWSPSSCSAWVITGRVSRVNRAKSCAEAGPNARR